MFTKMRSFQALVSALLLSRGLVAAQNSSSSLPVVDLGYELYRAADYNQSGGYYNFSNIRYAAPPLGDLRFAAPAPPATNRSVIQDGLTGRICPQSNAAWLTTANEFVPEYLATNGSLTSYNFSSTSSSNSSSTTHYSTENEDCLFLDVLVPDKIFEKAGKGCGAPVMVWIYGGGYVEGSKTTNGDPAGLIHRSQDRGSEGIVYVALNYRLGAFGWLAGPTFQENGTANAALYDQRMALNWVQDNIHLFGGDKNRVTVFGESAGGGSIMHQITAYGGHKESAPFQQAILQSSAWFPVTSLLEQELIYQKFLKELNVSSIAEARQLPSETVIAANEAVVSSASYGQFVFGPQVDGNFVPQNPPSLFLHGEFDKSVRVMVGHNGDEGLLFTPPYITNDSTYRTFLEATFPATPATVLDYIENELYPPPGNTSLYTTNLNRAVLTVSESIFICNAYVVDVAYNNDTYGYVFDVYPGLHGQDVAYTYYDPTDSGNQTVAFALQDYLTSFAMTGKPTTIVDGLPEFRMYGPDATVIELSGTSISNVMDAAANERCRWWNKGIFY
ncbi:alpha/beta-hydrolase [Saccharata proteae CBS 121410]|uniref:Carboxylic ester hydrolase n=1 Tax=Saccharata proteae CBS 121410 TaxID=1314787 RepID=A0A6A5YFL1_9PEZI|nr:alpha/beta-hydrolase [Saccharata proteae CBS 121410]